MSNIVKFPGITKHDIDTSEMLRSIADTNPHHAFLIIWPEDGTAPTYHSSTGDIPIVLHRINQFTHMVYNGMGYID